MTGQLLVALGVIRVSVAVAVASAVVVVLLVESLLGVVNGVPQATGALQDVGVITVVIPLTGHLYTAKPEMVILVSFAMLQVRSLL